MPVELPYASGTLSVTLPPGARRLSSEPALAYAPVPDLDRAVRAALASLLSNAVKGRAGVDPARPAC